MDLAGKNPRIELVASYNNDIVVSPTTWVVAFNHQLPAGLYIIKHSAFAIYGVNGISVSMDATGAYIGQIYVDHSTTATVKNYSIKLIASKYIYDYSCYNS